ncbi:MAG: glycosyltransferase family 87 protein [Proteobacteria bacterium]|nr:glycosyltransferase family 87 protein [Pseudomonadota bacterium]
MNQVLAAHNVPIRLSNKVLLSIWCVICIAFGWFAWPMFWSQSGDYGLYYSLGELFAAGQGMDIYVTGEQGPWFGYPAWVAPIFYVLQWIPLMQSRGLFFLLKILLLCTWPYLLVQCSGSAKGGTRSYVLAGASTLAVFPAIFEEILAGNINTFLLTLAFGAFALGRHGYYGVSAAMLTFIAAFKPQYALFLAPLALISPLRAIWGGLLSGGSILAIAASQFGLQGLIALMTRWTELMASPLALPSDANNMSSTGVIARLLSPLGLSQSGDLQNMNLLSLPYDNAMFIARIFAGALSVAMVGMLAKRWRAGREDWLLEVFSGICLVTLVVTPVIWLTHYMFLALPIFAIGQIYLRANTKLVSGVFFAMSGGLFLASQMFSNPPATMVFARAYGLPYFALVFAIISFLFAKCEEKLVPKEGVSYAA